MWVEALAGFANNQGGVLVWGIEARKDPATNVDVASAVKPVDNPLSVKSRLIELQRAGTDPPLANVEIEAYELASAPGTGFVVCFVPEGPFKPYRTEEGRSSQYHLRAGDSFFVMSRSILASMFYPRLQARFRVKSALTWRLLDRVARQMAGQNEEIAALECKTELSNEGTATARNLIVLVRPEIEGNFSDILYGSDFCSMRQRKERGREFEFARPVHPSEAVGLFQANWTVGALSSARSNNMLVPAYKAPAFTVSIYCDNQDKQEVRIEFDTEEMWAHREGCYREATVED
jgi:hypothetical protein